MTQEEKELMLKVLCAGLPYGLIVHSLGTPHEQKLGGYIPDIEYYCIKPYLRPMSSMTEEEEKEFKEIKTSYHFDEDCYILSDWLNAHHFDYRGLIPMDLALEAPNGMYNIK